MLVVIDLTSVNILNKIEVPVYYLFISCVTIHGIILYFLHP